MRVLFLLIASTSPKYIERKKKRIFWLSKRLIYYKNKFCLDTSNLYQMTPTIHFLKFFLNFCWWRIPLATTSLPRIGVHGLYVNVPELENKSLSKKIDRWIIFRLKVVSLITNNDNSWSTFPIYNRFRGHEQKNLSTTEWLNKTCLAYCTRLAESFKRIRNKNSQKISTGLARHHLQRFSTSDAAVSTQCNFYAFWIGIALALLKQCLICIQIFSSLFSNVNLKAASVQQEAASAVTSVDT